VTASRKKKNTPPGGGGKKGKSTKSKATRKKPGLAKERLHRRERRLRGGFIEKPRNGEEGIHPGKESP